MRIEEFATPASAEEAAALLSTRTDSVPIAGGAYVRLGSRRISLAVDLSRAGLSFVRKGGYGLELGAMTPLRALETDPLLSSYVGGILSQAVSSVVGIQFRNVATVGGTIAGRYGFSDLLTALLALGASLAFHRSGIVTLSEYLSGKPGENDLLEWISLPLEAARGAFASFRNSAMDFALLNASAALCGGTWRIAVGARPAAAALSSRAAALLDGASAITVEKANAAGEAAAGELVFGDDGRASASYRRALCAVLVRRAILAATRRDAPSSGLPSAATEKTETTR